MPGVSPALELVIFDCDGVLVDSESIAAGLPPARMQQAQRELVGRYRNRPVT